MPDATIPHLETNDAGYYEIRWTEGRRSRRVSARTKDPREAQVFLAGFIWEREKHGGRAPDKATVADVLGWYWDEHVVEHVIAKRRIKECRGRLVEGLGDVLVSGLEAELQRFVDRRRAGKIGMRPCGDATIRKELGVLSAACNHAVRTKRIAAAPYIKRPASPEARDRWLTREEAARLLAAAQLQQGHTRTGKRGHRAPLSEEHRLPRLYRFVMLGLETASRPEALISLRWEQVDLHGRLIMLNPVGRRQTRKRRPPVPISRTLHAVLLRAWGERVSDYVLDHPGAVSRSFRTAVKASKLVDVTPYTLRHTWATWAALDGVSLWKIAKMLGDTVATVEKNYAHHHPDYLRDAVDRDEPATGAQIGALRPDRAPYTLDNAGQDDELAAGSIT